MSGQVALVTGAGGGIGRAAAIAFAKRGYRTVVCDFKKIQGGNETVAMIQQAGGEATFKAADVSNEEEVKALMQFIQDTYGRLDCAYNNAGIVDPTIQGGIVDFPLDAFHQTLNTNVIGVFLCCKHEIPLMLETAGKGAIVNCASIAGKVGFASFPAYTASKHAVIGLTRAIAVEMASTNGKHIRCNAVCPGCIDTPIMDYSENKEEMFENVLSEIPMRRIGQPEEIAEAVVWLCSDAASYVTGSAMDVDGGWLAK